MKNEEKIVALVVIILMFTAIIGSLIIIKYNPWYLPIPIVFALIAYKLDKLERHPFVIQKRDIRCPDGDWEEKLIYTYSIKWLRFVYFYEIKILGNYPIIYHFINYELLPFAKKQTLLSNYFQPKKLT